MSEIDALDIIKVTLVANFDNVVECNNVFHYRVDSINETDPVENTLSLVGKALWSSIKAPLRGLTTNVMNYYSLECVKISLATGEEGDSMTYFIPESERAGLASGESLPPHVTWSFKFARPSNLFRHGYKRFSGVGEAYQSKGYPVAEQLDELDLLAVAMAAYLDVESGIGSGTPGVIAPVLIQEVKNGQRILPQVAYEPGSVQFAKIGSQNTRKYGRGS